MSSWKPEGGGGGGGTPHVGYTGTCALYRWVFSGQKSVEMGNFSKNTHRNGYPLAIHHLSPKLWHILASKKYV